MKKQRLLLILGMFLLLLGGCRIQEKDDSHQKKSVQIGVIFDTFVVERWQRDRDVFVATAQSLGAEVDIQNANGSVEKQEESIRYYIKKKMDCIVIVPIESEALLDEIRMAQKEGIKVISYDRLVQGGKTDLYVSFDSEEVGRLMGKAFGDTLKPGDGVVMVCGSKTDGNVAMMETGFRKAASEYGLEILDVTYAADWEAEEARKYVDGHVELMRKARGVMCGNDNLAGSVLQALAENQLEIPVVVGQDADLDACQRIVEESQYMTVYKPVEKLAKKAAEATVKLAKGRNIAEENQISDGKYQVPYIRLRPLAVTKKNINATIIDSGFHIKEEIYLNRPEEMP